MKSNQVAQLAVFILIVGILAFVFMPKIFLDSGAEQPAHPGDAVILSYPSNKSIVLLTDQKEDYAELSKYCEAKDKDGVIQMMNAGRCFAVDDSTPALMIAYGTEYEVRIKSGDKSGRSGFVLAEAVHKRSAARPTNDQ
jgi:hypothetical protein